MYKIMSEHLPSVFLLVSRADLILSIIIFKLYHTVIYNLIVFSPLCQLTKTQQKHLCTISVDKKSKFKLPDHSLKR